MENNRNFFITIALSVLILTLWQVFYMNPRIEAEREAARIAAGAGRRRAEGGRAAESRRRCRRHAGAAARRGARRAGRRARPPRRREAALAASQRVKIDTPSLSGSINLTGGRIDDVRLKHYHETVDDNSPDHRAAQPVEPAERLFRRDRLRRQRRDRRGARRRHGLDRRGQPDADAVDARDAHLHQRQGPDLQAHHLGRRRLHVHRRRTP